MAMATTDRFCCDCAHYLHGQLENPCEYNVKSVGYLRPACWRYQSIKGVDPDEPTKVCAMCGKEFLISNFRIDRRQPDKYSPYCKECYVKRKKLLARRVPNESKE